MEKLNVAERRTYVAPELSIAEFAIENGFGNSVASFEEETFGFLYEGYDGCAGS